MNNLDLFETAEITVPLESLVAKAKEAIKALFRRRVPVVCAFSGGKDSSVTASLVLTAAAEHVSESDIAPLVVVTTSDTLIENPEVSEHYRVELMKMEDFGRRHGFRVEAHVATPSLMSTWQMKILSGRGLPSFAGNNTDCSTDLKIIPQRNLRRALFKNLQEEGWTERPVTCLGTRFDESERRALNMKLRGENPCVPVENRDGDLILSPIAYWTTSDVWEYIGVMGMTGESYSDFKETMRIYAHAESQGCAVVASTIREGRQKKGGCGARHGCFLCQQSVDKSLENMVAFDERYAYADGLLRLNRFIRNTRHDMSRRHWVGRRILEGYIAIEPDTYHPSMVRELYRYMLQLDHDERARVYEQGDRVRFQIMPFEMVVAIDAYWSLNGLARPFSALSDYWAVNHEGVRYEIPEVEPVPKRDMPDTLFLHVGEDWHALAGPLSGLGGLRDAYIEALQENCHAHPELRELKDGRSIWDVDTDATFTVNDESVWMIEAFELAGLVKMNRDPQVGLPGWITYGYKWYLRYGAITLGPGQSIKHDEILRRTEWKDRNGLTLEYDIETLRKRCVRYADLPDAARAAWRHKATTSSSQTELRMVA